MGVVSRAIEECGIPTATLAMEEGIEAPRVGHVPFPYNFPMGTEGRGQHRRVALAALGLLHALEEPDEVGLDLRP